MVRGAAKKELQPWLTLSEDQVRHLCEHYEILLRWNEQNQSDLDPPWERNGDPALLRVTVLWRAHASRLPNNVDFGSGLRCGVSWCSDCHPEARVENYAGRIASTQGRIFEGVYPWIAEYLGSGAAGGSGFQRVRLAGISRCRPTGSSQKYPSSSPKSWAHAGGRRLFYN